MQGACTRNQSNVFVSEKQTVESESYVHKRPALFCVSKWNRVNQMQSDWLKSIIKGLFCGI
jgi:hypothetical protein